MSLVRNDILSSILKVTASFDVVSLQISVVCSLNNIMTSKKLIVCPEHPIEDKKGYSIPLRAMNLKML